MQEPHVNQYHVHSPYSLSERHSTQTTRGLIKNIFCSTMRKHCIVYETFNPLVGLSNYWNILSLLNKLLNNWSYILLLLTKEILCINRIFMCVVSYLQILLLRNVWLGCVSGDQGSIPALQLMHWMTLGKSFTAVP